MTNYAGNRRSALRFILRTSTKPLRLSAQNLTRYTLDNKAFLEYRLKLLSVRVKPHQVLRLWRGGQVRQRKSGPERSPKHGLMPRLAPEIAHQVEKMRALLYNGAPALGDVPPLALPDLRVRACVASDDGGKGAPGLARGEVWRAR